MKIIISPAKKMNIKRDSFKAEELPEFIEDTEKILKKIQKQSLHEMKKIWGCNDQLAELNYNRIKNMDLYHCLTPALMAYEGIQYQYMAPEVLSEMALEYLKEHLFILSGFYGVLRPFDGVVPYRLEMQAKLPVGRRRDLYDFWREKIYKKVVEKDTVVINLASKEYSKTIQSYLKPKEKMITCIFGEVQGEKVIQKGTMAKMARGEMVRFLAENQIETTEGIKTFSSLGYFYAKDHSDSHTYVFLKKLGNEPGDSVVYAGKF